MPCTTLQTLVWQLGTLRAEEKVQCVPSMADQKGMAARHGLGIVTKTVAAFSPRARETETNERVKPLKIY